MWRAVAFVQHVAVYDRFGSITSIPRCPRYVRLCSKSGDKADMETLRVRAINGLTQCKYRGVLVGYSSTSSARASSVGGTRAQTAAAGIGNILSPLLTEQLRPVMQALGQLSPDNSSHSRFDGELSNIFTLA